MPSIDGLPKNLRFQVETSEDSFSDISYTVLRPSIRFEPAEPGKPRRLTFKVRKLLLPYILHEWQEIRVDDPYTNPAAPYPRYYGGFIVDTDDGPEGASSDYLTINCLCYNVLLTRGPNQVENTVDIGGYVIWSSGLTVTKDMVIVPSLDNDHQYTAQNDGTTGGSEPTWPTGAGSTVADNGITWKETGRPRRSDKQAVEYIAQNYLPECTLAVNKHIDNLTGFTIEWETVESALAKVAVQANSSSYPICPPSTALTLGRMYRAAPPNDFFYEVTTAGTTTSTSPGTWGTDEGDTVAWGTAVLTCRGSTVAAPFAAIYPSADNGAHDAPWHKVLGWYDLLSYAEVPLLSVELIDTTIEDSTHIRYNKDAHRRRDGSQYRNTQTVQGNLASKGTVSDPVSIDYVNGRVVTGPLVKDDKLTTNEQCENAAWVVLGALGYARETITCSTTGKVPGDPIDVLLGPRRIKFSKASWGLEHKTYFLAGVGLAFSEGGVPLWSYQLGSVPQTLGENGLPRAMMGARYVENLGPPDPPIWPDDYLLRNQYNFRTHLTDIMVQWQPPAHGQGDLAFYNVRARDVAFGVYIAQDRLHRSQTYFSFVGTPASDYIVETQAEDIWGNKSDWALSPTISAAPISLPDPPSNFVLDTTKGDNGYDWTSATSAIVHLKFDAPTTYVPDGYILKHWPDNDPTAIETIHLRPNEREIAIGPLYLVDYAGGQGHLAGEVRAYIDTSTSNPATLTPVVDLIPPPIGPAAAFSVTDTTVHISQTGRVMGLLTFGITEPANMSYVTGWEIVITQAGLPTQYLTMGTGVTTWQAEVALDLLYSATIRAISRWDTRGPDFTPYRTDTVTIDLSHPTGLTIDAGAAHNGYDYIGFHRVNAYLTWAVPSTVPSFVRLKLRYWSQSNPALVKEVDMPRSQTSVMVGPLDIYDQNGIQQQYYYEIYCYVLTLEGTPHAQIGPIAVPTPPLGPATSVAIGTQTYVDEDKVDVPVSWVLPADTTYISGWEIQAQTAYGLRRKRVALASPGTIQLRPDTAVELWLVAVDKWGHIEDSPESLHVNFDVIALPAPTITDVTVGHDATGYFADVTVDHATLTRSYGGYVMPSVHSGSMPDSLLDPVPIPSGPLVTFPVVVKVRGLQVWQTYDFVAVVQNRSGGLSEISAVSTKQITPLPQEPPPAFMPDPTRDAPLGGWHATIGTDADFAIDQTTADKGQNSLKMSVPASMKKEAECVDIAVRPSGGDVWVLGMTVKRGSGSGTAPQASVVARFYNRDRSAQVGTDQTIVTAFTPTMSYSALAKKRITVPAGAYRMVLVVWGQGQAGASTYSVWFAEPYVQHVKDGDDLAASITLTDQQINLTGTSKLVAGGGKVEVGPSGIKVTGDPTAGANNIDFYDEDGTHNGQEYAGGHDASGTGVLRLAGLGTGTTVSVTSRKNLSLQADSGSGTVFVGGAAAEVDAPTTIDINSGTALNIKKGGTSKATIDADGNIATQGKVNAPVFEGAVATKTTGFTADATVRTYLCSPSLPFTVALPAASGCTGRQYTFKQIATAKVTIDPNGSETIDGITTYPLVEKYQSVTIESDGSNWRIVHQSGLVLESDGTRWLKPEQQIAFTRYSDSEDPPYTHSQQALIVPNRGDLTTLITRYVVGYYVIPTNNSSNYWDIALVRRNSANNPNTVATLTTSDKSGGTNATMLTTTFSNNPTVSNDLWLTIELTKVGGPGNLYLHGVGVYGRAVVS